MIRSSRYRNLTDLCFIIRSKSFLAYETGDRMFIIMRKTGFSGKLHGRTLSIQMFHIPLIGPMYSVFKAYLWLPAHVHNSLYIH